MHAIGELIAAALVGEQPPPAVRYPAQIQQRDLHGLTGSHPLGARGEQPLSRSAGVCLEKSQCLLDAGVLAGGAQGESVEEGKEGGAVALVGTPYERKEV